MAPNHDKGKIKRPYERPVLRVIELETDQVLGVGCKFADSGLSPFATPCTANSCSEPGS